MKPRNVIRAIKAKHPKDMSPIEFHHHLQDMASDNCNAESRGGHCIKHRGHIDDHWIKRDDKPQPKFWEAPNKRGN